MINHHDVNRGSLGVTGNSSARKNLQVTGDDANFR